jgi:predicted secreted hydrolase
LIARESLGMAGVFQKSGATFLTIKSWWAKIETGKHTLRADTNDFSFELTLKPSKPPVLHGQAGYSRKGSTPERASCYYSFSRLISKGTLTVDDKTMKVEGLSWMDHEFSTALLEPGIVGWDWFGLQLSDRTEIMLFRLRNEKGGLNPASSGTFIDAFGKPLHLTKENFSVEILDRWESAHSGAVYPSRWRITAFPLAMQLTVQANISDQEMQTPASTGVSYWEGSVSVNGSIAEHPVSGMGYVELTGYAKSFKAAM